MNWRVKSGFIFLGEERGGGYLIVFGVLRVEVDGFGFKSHRFAVFAYILW
jgi:hypothetical protein